MTNIAKRPAKTSNASKKRAKTAASIEIDAKLNDAILKAQKSSVQPNISISTKATSKKPSKTTKPRLDGTESIKAWATIFEGTVQSLHLSRSAAREARNGSVRQVSVMAI